MIVKGPSRVLHPRVLRGRVLSARATASARYGECRTNSVPLGKLSAAAARWCFSFDPALPGANAGAEEACRPVSCGVGGGACAIVSFSGPRSGILRQLEQEACRSLQDRIANRLLHMSGSWGPVSWIRGLFSMAAHAGQVQQQGESGVRSTKRSIAEALESPR